MAMTATIGAQKLRAELNNLEEASGQLNSDAVFTARVALAKQLEGPLRELVGQDYIDEYAENELTVTESDVQLFLDRVAGVVEEGRYRFKSDSRDGWHYELGGQMANQAASELLRSVRDQHNERADCNSDINAIYRELSVALKMAESSETQTVQFDEHAFKSTLGRMPSVLITAEELAQRTQTLAQEGVATAQEASDLMGDAGRKKAPSMTMGG